MRYRRNRLVLLLNLLLLASFASQAKAQVQVQAQPSQRIRLTATEAREKIFDILDTYERIYKTFPGYLDPLVVSQIEDLRGRLFVLPHEELQAMGHVFSSMNTTPCVVTFESWAASLTNRPVLILAPTRSTVASPARSKGKSQCAAPPIWAP